MNEKQLKKEIKRLKKENGRLVERLSAYTGGKKETVQRRFYDRARAAGGGSFAGYVKNSVSASGVYSIYCRIYFALNRFLRASAFLRTVRFVIRLAYSGTAAFVAVTAVALIFPSVIVFSSFGVLAALITRKRTAKRLENEICGKVFFVLGTARGEHRRWIIENGTLVEIKTSIFDGDAFGAKRNADGSYAVHMCCLNYLTDRLSSKKDVKMIKIF